MNDDVDVFVSARLDPAEIDAVKTELREWGVQPRIRRMPSTRGAAEFTWLLLLTIPAEIIVKTMLEQMGVQAYKTLQRFVRRTLGRDGTTDGPPPGSGRVVVIESADTGAQFALDADLPLEAYQQMVEALTGTAGREGLHEFDRRHERWVPAGA
jgi:hypothetical protein